MATEEEAKEAQAQLDSYEEKYTNALAAISKFERSRDLDQRKAAATTVVKDRSLFSFGQRKIKKFDGTNPDLYPVFIEEFVALLDSYRDANITDVEKLSLLREHVTGVAAERIADLSLSSKNYKAARALLDDIHGDQGQRTIRLHLKVQECKPAGGPAEGFNYPEMERITSHMDGAIRSMEQLGFDIQANGGWLLANFRRVYPKQFLAMWDLDTDDKRDQKNPLGTTATIQEFIDYARARTRTLYGTKDYKKKEKKEDKKQPKSSIVNSTQNNPTKKKQAQPKVHTAGGRKCYLCGGSGHESRRCSLWDKKAAKELRKLCADKGLCYGCGLPRSMECKCSPCSCGKGIHRKKLCYDQNPSERPGRPKVKNKGRKSHSTLKDESKVEKLQAEIRELKKNQSSAYYTRDTALKGLSHNAQEKDVMTDNVIMETLICKIKMTDDNGNSIIRKLRVFIDSGSNMNILRRSTASGASGRDSFFTPYVTGAERLAPRKERDVVFQLVALDDSYVSPKFIATTAESPTVAFPPVTVDPTHYRHLKGITFTEEYPRKEFVDIDLLLGYGPWFHIDANEMRRGAVKEPVAKKTKLGWILSGLSEFQAYHSVSVHRPMINLALNDPVQPVAVKEPKNQGSVTQVKAGLEKLWKMETIGIVDPVDSEFTVEQQRAKDMFYSKIKFDKKKNKYTVPLLWKSDDPELESNFRRALRRDEALCSRFGKKENKEQGKLFIEAVEAFFTEGYAEKMTEADLKGPTDGPVRYLSLQCVFRDDKPKPRPVFDASEKTQDGKSLNSEILQGPPNLNDLVEILLRYRTRPIVVTADIKAMFLRIDLLDGRDSHRFLWRRLDKSVAPTICRLLTVTFGVIDSPYKAIETVLYHATVHKDQFPLAHRAVMDDSYVDDILSGAKSVEEALKLYNELKTMLALGGFHLAKTMSNSVEFMNSIPEEERAPLKMRQIQDAEDSVGTHSALGAAWDPKNDTLVFTFYDKFEEPKNGVYTRRVILSQGSKVFDPSGLISPAMLEVKLILRECAEIAGGEWDTPMPEVLVGRFLAWREASVKQASVTIPRCVTPVGCEDIQLHIFTDASSVAYAACVYVRVRKKRKNHLLSPYLENKISPHRVVGYS